MSVGTRIILDKMITSFIAVFVGTSLSPKDPSSGEIFIFIVQMDQGSFDHFYQLKSFSQQL